MNKLEQYFEQDCSTMDKKRPPYDFYAMGYNRAKIEELEYRMNELEFKEKFINDLRILRNKI